MSALSLQTRTVLERDAGLLFHPYGPLDETALYSVESALGARLKLTDEVGTTHDVIDGMASWWSAVHGYRNPRLDAAAGKQLESFSHVMFGGLTHAPAVELAERLVALTPEPLRHVFLADSGSVSVEVALKLAVQYQTAAGRSGRQRFLALRGGYHGDTFAAMGVCDPVDGMHSAFPGLLAANEFAPVPPAAQLNDDGTWEYSEPELAAWESIVADTVAAQEGSLAGIVIEPVVQGAGGMRWYPPRVLRFLRALADEWGLLLIADEIATGFGRTGQMFACDWAGVTPDVMCVGKALTGGYMSLAAAICSENVAEVITGSQHRTILHGPTFMGNPLACAIACASLDELTTSEAAGPRWQRQIHQLQSGLRASLAPALDLDHVREVRVLGGIGVIELDEPVRSREVSREAVRRGAWVRPFRNLVYVMPPYMLDPGETAVLGSALVGAVERVHG